MPKLVYFVIPALVLIGYLLVSMRSGPLPANVSRSELTGQVLASDPNLLVVDIRTPEEWEETGVIENAALVTFTASDSFFKAIEVRRSPGQKIALVCRSGNRSDAAARQIAQQVDADVIDVAGGMNRILKEGYKPVKPLPEMGCGSC
ncbi:rhodanese-like domain-containing protein [Donghicola sp. XS_ASV15]|uniref:rhodanese-like domain-containing protein n=1 Tax=Donghicola sp. XS_ASV15 TaxID=3241295 RepID=UPI003515483D